MINTLRVIIAIFVFSISVYLVYDLFANGFNLYVLGASLLGFVAVHYIWPRKHPDDASWFDALEIVFDLPYRALAFTLRSIGRAVHKPDIDIDL
ncbi:hypothetical protein KO528_13215 [Saccharophagus degradans]|uniref:Uncharacterized protein n=1 Tax=Saccharophagus degradans TaxID=86304 RepID=A0AAW7XBY5_9GAMM|nr:hypothetical protein [Saccharophagus degradans]MBU2986314.1 hypothetical protein [Saccharophagus degradans]MDO6424357.1 hypothetical protein [Saccharophagus degradans]MDO6608436.1 hypothetical protein [Saccharophagus degradans]